MARLNEPPMSTDSLESLRRKLLRQNRDLAKSNNVKALRIRELEGDCACMLSENLRLRSRILELETELEDNGAQRIADHALAIKNKLESQVAEWSNLLAGLGVEPPMKRPSPQSRKQSKPRLSFSSSRPSPSQRRLRDIAREIEELGPISENKVYPRRSMNPEQILALRSVADSIDSPELGPPPMSHFIDEDPVKVDSPSRAPPVLVPEPSPKANMEPPVALASPQANKTIPRSPSPEKKIKNVDVVEQDEQKPASLEATSTPIPQPLQTGSKRKLSAREETSKPQKFADENQPLRVIADKPSIREKANGKTLKELAGMRKETKNHSATTNARKPLAAKSTNDDIASPKKATKPLGEKIPASKEEAKAKVAKERTKAQPKKPTAVVIESLPQPETTAPATVTITYDNHPSLFSPGSPDVISSSDENTRGGTPPPPSFTVIQETARPSRRNRSAVSYAEPNLRDKMRRPTKELFDAVAGEGRYARRSSQAESIGSESVKVKKETPDLNLESIPPASSSSEPLHDKTPASPLAGKGVSLPIMPKEPLSEEDDQKSGENETDNNSMVTTSSFDEVDVYEFTTSPQPEKSTMIDTRKVPGRRTTRRVSSAVTSDETPGLKERASSRRRSMML